MKPRHSLRSRTYAGINDSRFSRPVHPVPGKRHAFTLIELVVALVLASIMMVGLLRVVTVVSRESVQLRREQTDYAAAGFLSDRLRSDLINARGIIADRNSITLAGFLTGSNVAGTVRYEIVGLGRRRGLVRRVGNRGEWMWVGCGGLVYQPMEQIDSETPIPDATGGLPPIPGKFVIGILNADGKPLFREVIHHHAG